MERGRKKTRSRGMLDRRGDLVLTDTDTCGGVSDLADEVICARCTGVWREGDAVSVSDTSKHFGF